jgi:hypothetical protein
MSKSKAKVPTVKTRKKLVDLESASEHAPEIVHKFIDGESWEDLATEFHTSVDNVKLIVQRYWKSFTNTREGRMLIESQQNPEHNHKDSVYFSLKQIQKASFMNQEFLDMLSDEQELVLTEAEDVYCWIFVQTGDNLTAIKTAGLDVGMLKDDSSDGRNNFAQACYLRGLFLRRKPNIAAYIQKLKEIRFLKSDVSKESIQVELLEQLQQLKAMDQTIVVKREIRAILHLLGQTASAFSEKLIIEKIEPGKALDYLEELDSINAKYVDPDSRESSEEIPRSLPLDALPEYPDEAD